MVSSECTPYAKSGGLADVVASLSGQLNRMDVDVRILIPYYPFISLEDSRQIFSGLKVEMGFTDETVSVTETLLPESNVRIYFLKNKVFTERPGIYGDHGSHDYRDNYYRFALLSKTALVLSEKLKWIPDIIHSHDWPTGLTSSYLREYRKRDLFLDTETVFTIHNTGYQGTFSKYDLHPAGLPWEAVHSKPPKYKDSINYLRSGIENSSWVTTVSPGYAEEIKKEGAGHGLEKLLTERKESFTGILNGVDYSEWNPENDSLLEYNFSIDDLGNKWKLKEILQQRSGLETDTSKVLIGMVGRLVDQKGFGELCGNSADKEKPGAIETICSDSDIQLVILGTGEEWIEKKLADLELKLPNLKVYLEFDNSLAHLIEAGSDFFLMPSKYEPCGLNQIYSLKYGSVPIVTATGGLKDTVCNFFTDNNGTGFHIPEMSSDSISSTVLKAVDIRKNSEETIDKIRKRGMAMEFSWAQYAGEYMKIYRDLTD